MHVNRKNDEMKLEGKMKMKRARSPSGARSHRVWWMKCRFLRTGTDAKSLAVNGMAYGEWRSVPRLNEQTMPNKCEHNKHRKIEKQFNLIGALRSNKLMWFLLFISRLFVGRDFLIGNEVIIAHNVDCAQRPCVLAVAILFLWLNYIYRDTVTKCM